MNDKLLDVYNCLRLIDMCIEAGVLAKDDNPDNEDERKNNIVLYCRTPEQGEGWFSVNANVAAIELSEDLAGQNSLIETLEEAGVSFTAVETPPTFTVVSD